VSHAAARRADTRGAPARRGPTRAGLGPVLRPPHLSSSATAHDPGTSRRSRRPADTDGRPPEKNRRHIPWVSLDPAGPPAQGSRRPARRHCDLPRLARLCARGASLVDDSAQRRLDDSSGHRAADWAGPRSREVSAHGPSRSESCEDGSTRPKARSPGKSWQAARTSCSLSGAPLGPVEDPRG